MKIRIFPDKNYKAIKYKNKIIRVAIDQDKPIKELDYPEIYTIKITNYCEARCNFCYQDTYCDFKRDILYQDSFLKMKQFFNTMDSNQIPFYVNLSGGEPTNHKDFFNMIEFLYSINIEPTFTTNGMWINKEKNDVNKILDITKKCCKVVTLSSHSNLNNEWKDALELLINNNIKVNLNFIISDVTSINYFIENYNTYKDKVDYFILLPYMKLGRAKEKKIEWEELSKVLPSDKNKIAIGTSFYGYIFMPTIDISLFEPHIISKYLDLKDTGYLFKNSFETIKSIKTNLF